MAINDMLQTMSLVVTMIGVMGGLAFAYMWMRDRRLERHELRYQREELARIGNRDSESGTANGAGTGGYIVIDLPDEQKPLLHDVLKGFEEYAQLRGYKLDFSIDSTLTDKIAFKFTIADKGVTVSTTQVKQDLRDYIDKVRNGDPLDDLPIVIPEPDHHALVLAMKNRLSFLQHTYTAQQNVLQFYEETMSRP